jgi:hypothetical protein
MLNNHKWKIAGIIVLTLCGLLINGCSDTPSIIIDAKQLTLSSSGDLSGLNHSLAAEPLPDAEYSRSYDANPEYPSLNYISRYRQAFVADNPIKINKINLELAPFRCIVNDVRVFSSMEKAQAGFMGILPPQFGPVLLGDTSVGWNIAKVGDESKAWYYTSEVINDQEDKTEKQIQAEVCFRKGSVISLIDIVTWGGSLSNTAAFLLDLARQSEAKISNNVS